MNLSLKWKFFIFTSLIFFVLFFSTIAENKKELTKSFQENQAKKLINYRQTVLKQFERLSQRHLSIISSYSLLKQTKLSFERLDEMLDDNDIYWLNTWQEQTPIIVKNIRGHQRENSKFKKIITRSSDTVKNTSEPHSFIYCDEQCEMVTTALAGSELEDVYSIGSSFVNILENVVSTNSKDILVSVIEQPKDKQVLAKDEFNYLSEPHAKIWAATKLEENRELISKAFLADGFIREGNRVFQLKEIVLSVSNFGLNLKLYLLQDISDDINVIDELNRKYLTNTLVIWLVVQLLFYFMFYVYLKRLMLVIAVLPLIVEGKFEEVFKRLKRKKSLVKDELNKLEETIVEINHNTKLIHDENSRYLNDLEWKTLHNPLTNLPNQLSLEHFIKQNKEDDKIFLMTKIVDFKALNRGIGVQEIDRLLVKISEDLEQFKLQNTHVFHLFSDEFIIVYSKNEAGNVNKVYEHFLGVLSSNLLLDEGNTVNYEGRLGSYNESISGKISLEKIINKLKFILSISELRNYSIVLYNESLSYIEKIEYENLMVERVIKALDEDGMQLWFQPIWSVKNKNISHYEVLCRLKEPDGNMLFPDEFIPIAEKRFFIPKIDKIIIEKSLTKLKHSLKENPQLMFSINISVATLQEPDLINYFSKLLRKNDINASSLALEITEYSVIENVDKTLKVLEKLKQLGISIALDDFGTGYTSISYLKNMPLSYAKLDGSYVKDVLASEDNKNLVINLINLIQSFGLKCIAEYVEDQDITDFLAANNVEYLQGYHIGKPAPELLSDEFSPFK